MRSAPGSRSSAAPRSTWLALGCLVVLGGCSLVYDGSRFTSGAAGSDAGVDTGVPTDSGPATDAGSDDAGSAERDTGVEEDSGTGASCTTDRDCRGGEPEYCKGGTCERCDGDGDGFAGSMGAPPATSCVTFPHSDCDDGNAAVFPGQTPVCNNLINDSCFVGDGTLTGVTELGFVQPFDVAPSPADATLDEVDIYARSAGRAVVFTHLVESRRSPLVVETDLDTRTAAAMQPLDMWAASERIEPLVGTGAYMEVLHLGRDLRVGEIHVIDDATLKSTIWAVSGDGSPTRHATLSFDLAALAATGLRFTNPPALGQTTGTSELFWMAPTNRTEPVTALGTEGAHFAPIDMRDVGAPGAASVASSERFALFTRTGTPSYFLWDGNITSPATRPLSGLFGNGGSGDVIAPGAVATLDPAGARGGPYAVVALPKRGLIELHLFTCAGTGTCIEVGTGGRITTPGMQSVGVSMSPVSDTAVAFIVGDGDASDGMRFGFADFLGDDDVTWRVPPTVTAARIPSEGMGRLTALSLDVAFTPDTVVAGAGQAAAAYAYLREPTVTLLPSQLAVGGIRACVGYPGF